MSTLFQFKQFAVDQAYCAMKVNTDGVLLGACATNNILGDDTEKTTDISGNATTHFLDIGTGTGVIALMLAQRFPQAQIDGVEIDKLAATTAAVNFQASPFAHRLKAFPLNIEHYFMVYPDKKFDLVVTNPPFFIDSLKSAEKAKETARHTDLSFFKNLCHSVASQLTPTGRFYIILPLDTALLIQQIAELEGLFVHEILNIYSYKHSNPHRQIISFGLWEKEIDYNDLVIYESEKVYTAAYKSLLKNFLTIF
ncbi:MAG: tRNA1(Val) (adenine(37)-N6)-methyltransferase [Sphingobacteriaceae bacterium]